MTPLLESLIENLQSEGFLASTPKTSLLLAYSGGADSTALLYLLAEIKQKLGDALPLEITAAYFNHGWRGVFPEEFPLVHQHCMACHVPLIVIQADKSIPHTESAARSARYSQLLKLGQDLQVNAVLTAHHADDQIETLLFRILRGTGLDGLSGIQRRLQLPLADRSGSVPPIIRPLLDIARKNLLDYVQERNLTYFNDPSNQDNQFQRNYLRNQLIPTLSEGFPHVKNALFRLSLVAQGDLEIIQDAMAPIWQRIHHEDAKSGKYLDAVQFNQLGLPYQRRILKQFLAQHDIFLDFQSIEDLLSFIRGEGRKNLDSALKSLQNTEGGRPQFLSLYKNQLRILVDPEREAVNEAVTVPIPGYLQIPALNATFYAHPWLAPEKITFVPIRPNDSEQVFVQLGELSSQPLTLRTRQAGDVFQPVGMEKPMKLKKFLINRSVPRFERQQLKLLALGKEILWIPGLGISQKLQIPLKGKPSHLLRLRPGLHPQEEWHFTTETIEEEPPRLPPEEPAAFTQEELLTGAEPL